MSQAQEEEPCRDRRVLRAWQELHANYRIKVRQLAKLVGLSVSRLQHLIVEQFGITIRAIKQRLKVERLHEARKLLLHTDLLICEIRERAGYTHDANFAHDFKKLFQDTPAACRRKGA